MKTSDRSEALLQMALRAANIGWWDWDLRTHQVTFSAEWKRQLGYDDAEIANDFSEWETRVHPGDLPRVKQLLAQYVAHPWPHYEVEFRMRHRDGSWRWILAQADVSMGADEQPSHMLGCHIDITERKRAELELRRANRMLHLFSESNQALVRLTDESALLNRICEIAIEVGGYQMAWVGLADDDATGTVRAAACARAVPGTFGTAVHASWNEDGGGRPAAWRAICTGRIGIGRNAPGDPSYPLWRDAAIRGDFQAFIALPLTADGRTLGALSIYAADPDEFPPPDVNVLTELAGNLAFGLHVLRTRAERDRATEALLQSEHKLSEAERIAHIGYWEWDVVADRVPWSDETYRIFGLEPQSCVVDRARIEAMIHPDDLVRVARTFDGSGAGGPSPDLEYRIVRPDGEVRHVLSRVAQTTQEAGRPYKLFGTLQDITERKEAERKLQTVLDHLPDFIVRFDRECRHIYVNPSATRLYAAPAEQFLGKTPLELERPGCCGGSGVLQATVQRVIEEGEASTVEIAWPTPEGERYLEVRHIPETDEGGRVVSVLSIGRDMTKQIQAEQGLRNVLRHARTFVMRYLVEAPLGWENYAVEQAAASFRWTAQMYDEAAAQEVLPVDVPPGERFDFGWGRAKHPDDLVRMGLTAHRAFLAGAPSWQQEFRCVDRHGRVHWFAQSASIEPAGHGRWRVTTVNTDITERKRVEAALRASEERFSTVFHTSPTAICIVRVADDRFVDVNEAFIKSIGRSSEEIIGHTALELQFWSDPSERESWVRSVRERGAVDTFKFRGRKRSGERVVGLGATTRITLNGEEHYLSLIHDITELEQAEEALRESEQRFRQVTENIDEVFWLTDQTKDRMIYISPAYSRVWGRSCQSLYETPKSWLESIHPNDYQRVCEAARTQQSAGSYDLEYRIVRPDGSIRWIHDRAFPIKNEAGQVYRIAGVAEDVTVRRELEEQFRQSQKMEAIGRLAGGIAHDFNNLLAVIQIQSSLMLETEMDDDTKEGVQQIMAAAERAANLTRQLLTFSRRDVKQARDIDLGDVIEAMTKLLRRILGEDVALETRFAPALPLVNADPGMMEQVLMNLAVNARDAMPDGGRLIVALEAPAVDAERLATHPQIAPGPFVCLTVMDTGCGIPSENMSRIFEPFFTTKGVGRGTGLGLATVFGIVQQHRGWIEVESTVGRGTAFRVFLPARADSSPPSTESIAMQTVRGGSETVLLVEDDPAVRALTRSVLERYGYRVWAAESAAAALAVWEVHGASVDLLLTDLVMPGGMTGRELAERLAARKPGLKVMYTSGYSDEIVNQTLRLDAGRNFLQKPYAAFDLAASVRHCLDER